MTETETTWTGVDAVLTERRHRVLIITLNRPEVRNAVNGALAQGLAAALDALDADDRLVAGVLTGAGGAFCAGMDLAAFVRGESSFVEGRGFAGIAERSSQKPLVAAVERFAVAGGLEIALACDLIVASRGTKMGIPEVKRSLVAVGGALLRLPRRLPYHVVMELALTGDPLTAERLYDFGLVNRLTAPGHALDEALELAGAVSRNGPLAVAASKRVLQQQWDWGSEEAVSRQAEIADPVLASEDAREGSAAFTEKREPEWKGK